MSHTRNLLAMSKIEDFAAWAVQQGYEREKTRGEYEVLRLRWPDQAPVLFYTRSSTQSGGLPQHATAFSEGVALVRRWLRERSC